MGVSAAAVSRTRTRTRRTAVARPAKRVAARRAPARTRTVRKSPSKSHFQEAFREMVLRYYPGITLKKFDHLTKMVTKAVH